MRVESPAEINEVKALFKSVRELAKTLAGAHLDSGLDAVRMRIVCPAGGVECVDGFEPSAPGTRADGAAPVAQAGAGK